MSSHRYKLINEKQENFHFVIIELFLVIKLNLKLLRLYLC